jgi:hypothetical protein
MSVTDTLTPCYPDTPTSSALSRFSFDITCWRIARCLSAISIDSGMHFVAPICVRSVPGRLLV